MNDGERTAELRNEEIGSIRIIFRVAGILKAEGVARVLDDHVLESAAGAKTCDAVLTCITNSPERLAHILIRAPRGHPDAGKPLEQSFVYFFGGHPDAIDVKS